MNLYALLGGIGLAIAIFFGGYKAGHAVAALDAAQDRAVQQDRVIVKLQTITREVPKIVTRVVTKEVTVEKEVERVVHVIDERIPADCVLPGDYGLLLVAAARGLDPAAPGVADEAGGAYGCREVLEATLADLKAGWTNSARLSGLQEWAHLVTTEKGVEP